MVRAARLVCDPAFALASSRMSASQPTSPRSGPPHQAQACPTPDAVLASVAEGVVVVQADGTIIWCNPATERLLGTTAGEGCSGRINDATWQWVTPDGRPMPPDEHPIAVAIRVQRPLTNVPAGLARDDGTIAWLRVSVAPMSTGDAGPCWVATMLDVTREAEQGRRDEALGLQLGHVLDGANDGYWDWNIVTGAVVFSHRWAAMLGYTIAEVDPHVDSWSLLVHPDDLPAVEAAVQAHINGETPFYESEHRLRHRDGRWIWVLDRGKVVERGEDGTARRACGTHSDITRRREVEATNAELMRELERTLANVRQLSGLLPICAWCRRLRSDAGYWSGLEEYLQEHTHAEVTHGICPDCERLFNPSER